MGKKFLQTLSLAVVILAISASSGMCVDEKKPTPHAPGKVLPKGTPKSKAAGCLLGTCDFCSCYEYESGMSGRCKDTPTKTIVWGKCKTLSPFGGCSAECARELGSNDVCAHKCTSG